MRARAIITSFAALGAAASCSLPSDEGGFSAGDPSERVRAAAITEDRADERSVRDLISMLDSDDPAARMVASASLRRLTDQDFGYNAAAPEPERRASADRWEAWYRRTYLGQDAPDPVTGESHQYNPAGVRFATEGRTEP